MALTTARVRWPAAHPALMGAILAPEGTPSAQLPSGASARCHHPLLTHTGAAPAQRDPNAKPRAAQARQLLRVFPTQQQVPTVTAEHCEWQRAPLLRQVFNKTLP